MTERSGRFSVSVIAWLQQLSGVLQPNAARQRQTSRLGVIRCGVRWVLSDPFGVIGADMGCKLFVALQLEVAHHFIERRACGRTRGAEPPTTLGATKTPKTLLVNPYQLSAHGLCRCAQRVPACCQGTRRSASSSTAPFAAAYSLIAAENRYRIWASRMMHSECA